MPPEINNRTIRKFDMRLGAYDGAYKRRHVLFVGGVSNGERVYWRHEFDTRREAKAAARRLIEARP
jgi:hypothetical protein